VKECSNCKGPQGKIEKYLRLRVGSITVEWKKKTRAKVKPEEQGCGKGRKPGSSERERMLRGTGASQEELGKRGGRREQGASKRQRKKGPDSGCEEKKNQRRLEKGKENNNERKTGRKKSIRQTQEKKKILDSEGQRAAHVSEEDLQEISNSSHQPNNPPQFH